MRRAGAWTARVEDTGWQPLSYASGFIAGSAAGQIRWKCRDGVVTIIGGAEGTFTSGNYTTVTTTPIPEKYRPPFGQNFRTGQMGSSMRGYCGGEVSAATGLINLGWNESGGMAPPAWISAGFTYQV